MKSKFVITTGQECPLCGGYGFFNIENETTRQLNEVYRCENCLNYFDKDKKLILKTEKVDK